MTSLFISEKIKDTIIQNVMLAPDAYNFLIEPVKDWSQHKTTAAVIFGVGAMTPSIASNAAKFLNGYPNELLGGRKKYQIFCVGSDPLSTADHVLEDMLYKQKEQGLPVTAGDEIEADCLARIVRLTLNNPGKFEVISSGAAKGTNNIYGAFAYADEKLGANKHKMIAAFNLQTRLRRTWGAMYTERYYAGRQISIVPIAAWAPELGLTEETSLKHPLFLHDLIVQFKNTGYPTPEEAPYEKAGHAYNFTDMHTPRAIAAQIASGHLQLKS